MMLWAGRRKTFHGKAMLNFDTPPFVSRSVPCDAADKGGD